MRILIIEDNAESGTSLSDTLIAQNYQCDIAENMGDAKYYLDIRNYDLVLLAWSQENENTIDLVATIKTDAHKTSVIVISERKDKESEIKALKGGADDFIRKPVDSDIYLYVSKQNFVLVSLTSLRSKT